MSAPYERYASIYDRIGQARFGQTMARLTLEWLQARDFEPDTVLDLATGTGAAALIFAKMGIPTTGLDRSEEMLERARFQAASNKLSVEFLLGEMQTFSLDEPVALVTSFYDSINYLLYDDDIRQTFRSVARALRPGGWFVFDVNTLSRYERSWNNSTEVAFKDDDTLAIYRSLFEPTSGISPLTLTVFERVDLQRNLWSRWDETHVERGYRLADIEAWLREIGFDVVAVEALNEKLMQLDGPATERSDRAVFFTRTMLPDPEPEE